MIGIFGGTFDPVHYGHLNPVLQVSRQISFERVIFVPAARPPHRAQPVASFEHRVNMLRLALETHQDFELDVREQEMGGVSYTVRTLESFREELGNVSLALFMGADAFAGIETWFRWQDILDMTHLIVMNRPGVTESNFPDWVAQRTAKNAGDLPDKPGGNIHFVTVEPETVSATEIRTAIAQKESIAGKTPDSVIDYIEANNLYRQVS